MRIDLKILALFLFLFISYQDVFSQSPLEKADEYFNAENFIEAIPIYEQLLKDDKKKYDFDLNVKAGLCYQNGHLEHEKAVPYFENAMKSENADYIIMYFLGVAYQHALMFDKATAIFNKYKNDPRADIELADKHLKEINVGKKLMANKKDIAFKNIGENINSKYADYYPFVTKDGTSMTFTARTNRSVGGFKDKDGYFSSDIWMAESINGVFQKAKSVGSIVNSTYDDQCVGLSDNGQHMFIYSNREKESGDIYLAEKTLKSFKKPELLFGTINSPELESSASLSEDGNTMFFASNRPGGAGELDIYMTRKLPTGTWGDVQNIVAINTPFNEDFPTLSADGQTLYFCSQGHENMGGYDIFVSTWDPSTNEWSKPHNMGYPLNTPGDEQVISFIDNGYTAYYSAIRPEGMGDYDIYEVTFNYLKPKLLMKVKLKDAETEAGDIKDADIFIYNSFDEQIARCKANQKTGEFLLYLGEGEYNIEIDSPDHQYYTGTLSITMDMIVKEMINQTFTLEK